MLLHNEGWTAVIIRPGYWCHTEYYVSNLINQTDDYCLNRPNTFLMFGSEKKKVIHFLFLFLVMIINLREFNERTGFFSEVHIWRWHHHTCNKSSGFENILLHKPETMKPKYVHQFPKHDLRYDITGRRRKFFGIKHQSWNCWFGHYSHKVHDGFI